jgi:pimeloyl-ACP methyl ester carboxylesterase
VPTLDRDDVRISYDVHVGRRDATPLLLSHGYGASRAMWRPNIDELVVTRSVVTWDMRGHGESASPADESAYSHALTVGDMVAVLDACGIEQAAVGGLSLGGYVSLEFYRSHPDRVRCLLLFDTGPGFKNDAARQRWNDYANDVASQAEADSAGLARAARGMLAQRNGDVIGSLPEVKVPTLVLVGADDSNYLAAADYMASTIPHAEKVVVPAAGHAANIDQPDIFNDAVISFLRRHEKA